MITGTIDTIISGLENIDYSRVLQVNIQYIQLLEKLFPDAITHIIH